MKTEGFLGEKTLQALKWSALAEVASKAIAPLTFLLLARVLTPEDFGVVAAATLIISFSQVFSEAGLPKALIQRQTDITDSANVTFWLSLSLAMLMTYILVASSNLLADFFRDPRLAPVVCVLTLQLLLSAFSSAHVALLQKEMQFKRLFWVRLFTTAGPAVASIPLALKGFGYWALVIGTLCGQLLQCMALWWISTWRPKLSFDRRLAQELLSFAAWSMLSGVLVWFYAWMDALVVGRYLGAHDMGLYRTGNTLVTLIFGVLLAPALPVLYSQFSRQQHDVNQLTSSLMRVAHIFALIAVPMSCFLFITGDLIGLVVFGDRWHGIGAVIGILGLMHGLSWIVGANGEVYRAIGKPQVEAWVNLSMLGVYLAGYLASVNSGLQVFLVTRLALAVLAAAAHIFVARGVLRISVAEWLFGRTLSVPIASFVIASIVDLSVLSVAIASAIRGLIFIGLWALGTLIFNREFLTELRRDFFGVNK